MTREDIVSLWNQANNWGIPIKSGLVEELERFAAFVAAAEREACAKVCDGWLHADGDQCAAAIRARGNE